MADVRVDLPVAYAIIARRVTYAAYGPRVPVARFPSIRGVHQPVFFLHPFALLFPLIKDIGAFIRLRRGKQAETTITAQDNERDGLITEVIELVQSARYPEEPEWERMMSEFAVLLTQLSKLMGAKYLS